MKMERDFNNYALACLRQGTIRVNAGEDYGIA